MTEALSFQDIILQLHRFWAEHDCLIWNPYNVQVGAGTMNPATVLRVLGPEPWNVGYVEPSVRPDDSRYGENPNRFQQHIQYQVILKPAPENSQDLYLDSLAAIGIDRTQHDIRFVQFVFAGAVIVVYGSPRGLREVGADLLTADTAGVPSQSNAEFGLALAAADFDGDGSLEIAVGFGTGEGSLVLMRGDGTPYNDESVIFTWDYALAYASPAIADIDDDGEYLTEEDWKAKDKTVPLAGRGYGLVYCMGFIAHDLKQAGKIATDSRGVLDNEYLD